jgi:hypothetical protein
MVNCASPSRITNISSTTVVKVMADAGAGRNDAAMQEVELRRQRAAVQSSAVNDMLRRRRGPRSTAGRRPDPV